MRVRVGMRVRIRVGTRIKIRGRVRVRVSGQDYRVRGRCRVVVNGEGRGRVRAPCCQRWTTQGSWAGSARSRQCAAVAP